MHEDIDGLNRAGRSGSGGIAQIWQKCLFSLLFRFANEFFIMHADAFRANACGRSGW